LRDADCSRWRSHVPNLTRPLHHASLRYAWSPSPAIAGADAVQRLATSRLHILRLQLCGSS
jgi:hypothetical protein